MTKKKILPSSFTAIDEHTGGGYKPGTVFIARTREQQPDELQDFIMNQVKQFACDGHSVLIVSLGMDMKEFVKCLIIGERPEQIETIGQADFHVCDKNPCEDFDTLAGGIRRFTLDNDIDAIVIDGIEEILHELPEDASEEETTRPVRELLEIAGKRNIPIIVSDYGLSLDLGFPLHPAITEMELKTDINGTVQAGIFSAGRKTVTEDLYGLWKIFDKILRQ